MKSKIKWMLCVIGLIASSCKKDKTPLPIDPECAPFEATFEFELPAILSEVESFSKPCFNPNNNQEFIYYYNDFDQDTRRIYKYNLQTQQKTLIVEGLSVFYEMKWSTRGWISFTSADMFGTHVYIVQESGEYLTQVSSSNALTSNSQFWNASGNRLYWNQFINQTDAKLVSKSLKDILNGVQGNERIEGDKVGFYNAVSQNNWIVSYLVNDNERRLHRANLNDSELNFQPFFSLTQFSTNNLTGLCFAPNNHEIYFTIVNQGLYKFDLSSSKLALLKEFCGRKRYEEISCSSDGKYMLSSKITSRLDQNESSEFTGLVIEKSAIFLIDLQTMKEIEIFL